MICQYCGEEFNSINKNQKYCNGYCRGMFWYQNNKEKEKVNQKYRILKKNKKCQNCGKVLTGHSGNKTGLCMTCVLIKRNKEKLSNNKNCTHCGKQFKGNFRQKYCSPNCAKLAHYYRYHERKKEENKIIQRKKVYGSEILPINIYIKICKFCSKTFTTINNRKEYCCKNCITKASKKRNPKRTKQHNLKYYKKRKANGYIRKWQNEKRHTNPHHLIRHRLQARIKKVIINKGFMKSTTTEKLLGCNLHDFVKYIESQFLSGMTFDNHGEWHIDHIIPCASFDLSIPEQQKKCFHYTNLQPLWAEDNIKKGAKVA